MNNFFSILLQSSLCIATLYIIYYTFLRNDTFFKTNRFYLISALLVSAIIPFIDFSFLLPAREQVYLVLLDPLIITTEGIRATMEVHSNIYQPLIAVYLTGVTIFAIRFIYQLIQLVLLIQRFGISKYEGVHFVFTDKIYSPFSFFNLVFLNRRDIDSQEAKKIIAHERVHIRQWHSLDLLLLEFITIIQWFNPFIWLYRHAVKTLHEYLADEGVLHSGVDAKVYSALLFSQSTGIQINDLTNNFSKSLLKRRFIMMTKERTTKFARLKLLFAFPLALSFMLVISCSTDVAAQQDEKAPPPPSTEISSPDKPPGDPSVKPELTIINVVSPQDQEKPVPIYTVVEVMPKYPGGLDAMYKFLAENIKYPQKAKEEGISGTVYVQFIVEKDGQTTGFKILRGAAESLDNEALRVVKTMPIWEPGTQRGKPVRVQYNLPIKFKLDDEKEAEEK